MTTGVRGQGYLAPAAPRRRWFAPPVALTGLAVLAGLGYRLWLLLHDAPPTNSDEATMGLAALHIAQGRHLPVWFYGQSYMGTLEAYLAAPLFALAGPSVLALRLPLLALYAAFLLLTWRLTRRLGGGRWFALLVVGLLALGSDRVVKNQFIAGGGYPELNPMGAGLALLTLGLCAAGRSGTVGDDRVAAGVAGRPGAVGDDRVAAGVAGRSVGRAARWAGWGLLAGLTVWVDPLLLPYVAATGAVLAVWCRRELVGRAGALVAAGALAGAAPMLGHSLAHGRNPLAAVFAASGAETPASWADRLHGGLVLGPPLGMGFCSPSHCAPWQLWWAAAFPVLLALATLAAWRALRRPRGTSGGGFADAGGGLAHAGRADAGGGFADAGGADPDRADEGRAGAAVRLALLAGAAGSVAAYAVSNAAGRTPVESARYLSCVAIALPALLWPLRDALRARRPGARGGVARVAALAVLAATVGTAAVATVDAVGAAGQAREVAAQRRALVAALDRHGVRHIYGGYWTCNAVTFATAERVVCAVVDDELRPGFDRYPAYREAVRRAANPAYVAPVGSPLAARLDRELSDRSGGARVVPVDGWRIYLPGS
ncbi:hypothetical protein [Micromonospora okii]|uniref:hypothetical protein n=1 Tax=Micromonospora okii TaxID=1182970 RepID=UPI001E5A2A92|nr:hypothetical protein [Micromonospora okii]